MKESIKNCFENADAELLNGFFEKYKGEQMPEESLARLREKMLGKSAKKPAKKRGFKRLIPVLAAAACLLIGLGIAYKTGAFNKHNTDIRKPDTVQGAYSATETPYAPSESVDHSAFDNDETIKLNPSTKTKDKLDIRSLPASASQSMQACRDLYRKIRFFESGTNAYAITSEYGGIFGFDGNSFIRTGPSLPDVRYFDGGAHGGYVYIPGNWYCWGQDSGLYRFELKTGKVERFVSTDETVLSVAADGPNIYYSSRTGSWHPYDEDAAYSLKCVNAETGEIIVLIQNASYSISDLKCANGNVYFSSYYKGVFYITPDMYLHAVLPENVGIETVVNDKYSGEQISIGSVDYYDVEDDTIYICRSLPYEYNYAPHVDMIEAYDHTGNKLGGVEVKIYRDGINSKDNLYFNDFTAYNGRLVCSDENGIYLLDIASGEREKIMGSVWNELIKKDKLEYYYFYPSYVTQTVFGGKLYIGIGANIVYEYDNGRIRGFDLSEEKVIESSIRLIRYEPDGSGISIKTLPPCELATEIISELTHTKETGETCEKISDAVFSETAVEMPAEPGTLWLEVYSDIYRISPDFDEMWRVNGHFGEGKKLEMYSWLTRHINQAWYAYPFDYYTGIYDNSSDTFDLECIYGADSNVWIYIQKIEVQNADDPKNSIVLEVTSSVDIDAEIRLDCMQGKDISAQGERKNLKLEAEKTQEVELTFGGWKDVPYWIEITSDNIKYRIQIIP